MTEWAESVWVVAEASEGPEPDRAALEALAQGRELARNLRGGVRAVVLAAGDVPGSQTESWLRRGADRLAVLRHADLAGPDSGMLADAMEATLSHGRPRVIVVPESDRARAWVARLAARLRVPVVTGCIQAMFIQELLRARRAACRNSIHIHQEFKLDSSSGPALLLMAPGSWYVASEVKPGSEPKPADVTERIEYVDLPGPHGSAPMRRTERTLPRPGAVELGDAALVLSGGAGLRTPEGFAQLRSVAGQLGAAVGSSRLAVDKGWARPEEQVGITGRSIAPKVYLALGISGAREHLGGLSEVENIIAVNLDRNAPIASVARTLLLGDAREVLTALAAEATRRLERTSDRKG